MAREFYIATISWRGEGNKSVAAALPRFVQTSFGAIDPFGHAIFRFVRGTRRGFGNDSADEQIRITPGRPGSGRNLAKLFSEHLGAFQRSVRQNKYERPRRIFYRDIGLANGRR